VCFPGGARLGSKRLACTSSTKGRAACSPPATASFRGGDFVECAADVDGAGPRDLGRAPWDRAVEGPVELEHSRPRAIAPQPPGIALWQALAGERSSWRGVRSTKTIPVPASSSRDSTSVRSRRARPASAARPRARRRGAASRRERRASRPGARSSPERSRTPRWPGCARTASSERSSWPVGRAPARPRTASARVPSPTVARWAQGAPSPAGGGAGGAGRGSRA
jgi:hypothetical protein